MKLLHSQNPSVDMNKNEVVFRTPRGISRTLAAGALLPVILSLLIMPGQFAGLHARYSSSLIFLGWAAVYAGVFCVLPLLLAGLVLRYTPGPQELSLNKDCRTYQLKFGTFLKPQVRSGSWQDIEGIRVRPMRGKYGQTMGYGVYVVWRQDLTGGPSLRLSRHKEQAEWSAQKIAAELGLQVVP